MARIRTRDLLSHMYLIYHLIYDVIVSEEKIFFFEVTYEALLVPGGKHQPVPKARHRYRVMFSPGTNVKGSISTGW